MSFAARSDTLRGGGLWGEGAPGSLGAFAATWGAAGLPVLTSPDWLAVRPALGRGGGGATDPQRGWAAAGNDTHSRKH